MTLRRRLGKLRALWQDLRDSVSPAGSCRSYAQEGEDVVLKRLFEDRQPGPGFYVDVGAHHPKRFSNTYYFYRRGWRGINIDAMPGGMQPFRRLRPRDVNLEIALSDQAAVLTYYLFDEPALNGFSAERAKTLEATTGYRVVGTRQIRTRTLADVLDEHLPHGQPIDFLSVDVEGLDCEVLRSNDWQRYRPTFVLAEDLESARLDEAADRPVAQLLAQQGYLLRCKTVNTLFFQRRS